MKIRPEIITKREAEFLLFDQSFFKMPRELALRGSLLVALTEVN